jgi:hypothetical protein
MTLEQRELLINGIKTLKSLYKGEKLDKKIRELFIEQNIPYDESLLSMKPSEIVEIQNKLGTLEKGSLELIDYLSDLVESPIYDVSQLLPILKEYKDELKIIKVRSQVL